MSHSRLLDAINLQKIANNPLSPEDIAMFEMFEREGWSPERRRRYIGNLIRMETRARSEKIASEAGREPNKPE